MRPPPPPSSRRPPPLQDEQPARVPDSLVPVRLADLVEGPPTDRLYPPPPPGLADLPPPPPNLVHPPPPADLVDAATKAPTSARRKLRARFSKLPTLGAFVAGAIIILGAQAAFFASSHGPETPPPHDREVIAPKKPLTVVVSRPSTREGLDAHAAERPAPVPASLPFEVPHASATTAPLVAEPKPSALAPLKDPKPSTSASAAVAAKPSATAAVTAKPSATATAAGAENPSAPAAVFEWKLAQGSSGPKRAVATQGKRSSRAKGSEPYKPPTAAFPVD